jgi:hypothetical protein
MARMKLSSPRSVFRSSGGGVKPVLVRRALLRSNIDVLYLSLIVTQFFPKYILTFSIRQPTFSQITRVTHTMPNLPVTTIILLGIR